MTTNWKGNESLNHSVQSFPRSANARPMPTRLRVISRRALSTKVWHSHPLIRVLVKAGIDLPAIAWFIKKRNECTTWVWYSFLRFTLEKFTLEDGVEFWKHVWLVCCPCHILLTSGVGFCDGLPLEAAFVPVEVSRKPNWCDWRPLFGRPELWMPRDGWDFLCKMRDGPANVVIRNFHAHALPLSF
jgi:hypothetical protein